MRQQVPVLERELRRLSRRRGTWFARAGLAVLGLGVVVLGQVRTDGADPSMMAYLASDLMEYVVGLLLVFVTVVVPVVAAQAVEEERVDGTLDLLVLTPLPTAATLWGKVASRLVHVLTLVLGVLPSLGLLSTFGAIAPMEVVCLGANLLLLAVLLAQVATALVIAQHGRPLRAAMGTWVWCAVCTSVATIGLSWGPTWLFPTLGVFAHTVDGLVPLIVWTPVVVVFGWLGPLLFRLATGADDDDELGLLSAEVWTLRRYERRMGVGLPLLAGGALLYAVAHGLLGGSLRLVGPVVVLCWTWLAALVGLQALLAVADHGRVRRARSRRAEVLRRVTRGQHRPVGRFPLWWRLTRTDTVGGARRLPLWIGLALAAIYGVSRLLGAGSGGPMLGLGVLGCGIAVVLAGLYPLLSVPSDRGERQRDLLVVAGVSSGRLVAVHLLAALARSAWLWLPCAVAFQASMFLDGVSVRHDTPWLAGPSFALWAACVALSHASLTSAAAWLAPRRTTWPAGATLSALWLAGPLLARPLVGREGVDALALLQPFVGPMEGPEAFTRAVLASVPVHLAVALLAWGVTTWRVGRR